MNDIYALSDAVLVQRLGENLRSERLKQNITQQQLSENAGVSLSTVKKLEKGEGGSFDSLLRVLRTLGRLEVLAPLVEEPQLSPNEYYELVQKAGAHKRKRAAGRHAEAKRVDNNNEEDTTW